MSTDLSTTDTARNGTHMPPAVRPVMPPQELFEREPEDIGPLSDELRASLVDRKWIEAE